MYTSILKRLLIPAFLALPLLMLNPQVRHALDGLSPGTWEVHP
jgi:hypothetical protein